MANPASAAIASSWLDGGCGGGFGRKQVGGTSGVVSGGALLCRAKIRFCCSRRISRLGWWQSVEHGTCEGFRRTAVLPRALLDSARYRQEKAAREARMQEEDEDDDDGTCPVECVREFNTASEFEELLAESKRDKSLVVVDFYRTACGSCKYIEKGFIKLCKGSGNNNSSVTFLKHNVMDEYEEQSEVAAGYKIRNVPLFHFYKDGDLVEAFTTREKSKILAAIYKHTGQVPDEVPGAQAG